MRGNMRLLVIIAGLLFVAGCKNYHCGDYVVLNIGGCDTKGKCGVTTSGGNTTKTYPAIGDIVMICKWEQEDDSK
jgi:hypothetical protein